MSKYNGQTKKKQEERTAKKKSGVEAMIASVTGMTQKFANEWSEKHNNLSKHVDKVFNTVMQEIGKVWHNQKAFAESLEHVDGNVLAFTELLKDLYAHTVKQDLILKRLCEMAEVEYATELTEELKKAGLEAYTEQVKAAFAVVLEKKKAEYEARAAAAEKKKEEAKAAEAARLAAEAAKTEADVAAKALAEAEGEKLEDVSTTGGKGQDIPEGAQVFGG